jgi:hypothetical protein
VTTAIAASGRTGWWTNSPDQDYLPDRPMSHIPTPSIAIATKMNMIAAFLLSSLSRLVEQPWQIVRTE